MANKTIHQLTPASTITGDTQFAIYDTVSDSTKKATASQILGTEDILYADDPSTPSGTVDFTTQDTSLNPTSSVSVDLLTGSDSWSQRFVKISQMFKNIRYLLGKLGSTDISSIGDGSVTGALNLLNNNLTSVFIIKHYSYTYTCPASGAVNITGTNLGVSTPEGYTPVGIITYTTNSNEVLPRSMIVTGTGTWSFCVLTNKSNAAVSQPFSIDVLYVRTDAIA